MVMAVPGTPAAPGASAPPVLMVTRRGSTRPVPVSVPPEPTVTREVPVIAPSTSSTPPSTAVAPP